MARYEVEWEVSGSAVIEADDEDEARQLTEEAVGEFASAYAFEEFTVDEQKATSVEEIVDDE